MTYSVAILLLCASLVLLALVIRLWWSLRALHRQLVQQTADLQRVETMLRAVEGVSFRRTGWHHPQHVIDPNAVPLDGGTKFSW